MGTDGGTHWLVKALYLACGVTLLANLGLRFGTHAYDHAHFVFETWPGFVSVFGFAGFCVLIFGARILRRLVIRPEDYYGDRRPIGEEPEDASGGEP